MVRQTNLTLNEGFDELQNHHKTNISQLVSASIGLIKQNLESYARILQTDNDLAGAYLLAIESRDVALIRNRLRKIKSDVGFHEVDIISPRRKPINNSGIMIPDQTIREIMNSNTPKTLVVVSAGRLTMLSLSPLRLYEKPVGVILLAENLEDLINTQVAQNTNSRITLKLINSSSLPADMDSQYTALLTPEGRVHADIDLNGSNNEIAAIMSYRLVWVGALSIIVLAFLYYLFLELGFIRQFMSIVSAINEYTGGLARGNLSALNLKVNGLSEVQLLSTSFLKLTDSLLKYRDEVAAKSSLEAEAKRQKSLSDLARQVAHDIRSPLSALAVLLQKTQELPEENRVLARMAITRITDIANNLLAQNVTSNDVKSKNQNSKHLISSVINEVVSEKRIAYRDRLALEINYQANAESFGLFSIFQPVDFKRILSNLIDNSVEALHEHTGIIHISIASSEKEVLIKIQDNGKGIPKDILHMLGQKGFSYGKSKFSGAGSGLGLHHAKTLLSTWGGGLSITSEVDKGTVVTINLPKVEIPSWFAKELKLAKDGIIVAIDDDISIHKIWDNRLINADFSDKIYHFSKPTEFQDWKQSLKTTNEDILYLVDYEFVGSDINGLDLIESAKIAPNAILVTSHFDDPKIVAQAIKLGIKMCPKEAAGLIPISIGPSF